MRRSVPLLRSDYQFEPTGNQSQTFGISLWLPYYGTGVGPQATNGRAWGSGQYVMRSSLAPCYTTAVDPNTATDKDWADLISVNHDFQQIQHDLLYSDFYPLTEFSLKDDAWMVLQFDRPKAGTGTVLAFRRPKVRAKNIRVQLQGLLAAQSYRVKNLDRPGVQTATGQSLYQSGLEVELSEAPAAAIFKYAVEVPSRGP